MWVGTDTQCHDFLTEAVQKAWQNTPTFGGIGNPERLTSSWPWIKGGFLRQLLAGSPALGRRVMLGLGLYAHKLSSGETCELRRAIHRVAMRVKISQVECERKLSVPQRRGSQSPTKHHKD
jgi:hypothetical protein